MEPTKLKQCIPESQRNVYKPKESRRMLKNVFVMCFVFMLNFTAFCGVANVKSSINFEEGLGNYSMVALYTSFMASSLCLPPLLIRKISTKWTLFISTFGYSVYIASNFYPTFGTLIPAGIFSGLCSAPFWVAAAAYLANVGREYANLIGDNADPIIVRFFGIWYMGFQSSQIWGNIISSTILSSVSDEGNSTIKANHSEKDISRCGASFCPADAQNGDLLVRPSEKKITLLIGVYVGIALMASALVAIFLDPGSRYGEGVEQTDDKQSTMQIVFATFRQAIVLRQILIVPISFWAGYQLSFLAADFTQAFLSCSWGVENVGYVMICFGVCDAICSVSFSPIVRRFGRPFIFIFGALLNYGLIATMFFWKPNPESPFVYFVISGLWGVSDAVWQPQIKAFVTVLFPQSSESAFSNLWLWESMGFLVAYLVANNACMNIKLWSQVGVLTISMLGYLLVEILWQKEQRSEMSRRMSLVHGFAPNKVSTQVSEQ